MHEAIEEVGAGSGGVGDDLRRHGDRLAVITPDGAQLT